MSTSRRARRTAVISVGAFAAVALLSLSLTHSSPAGLQANNAAYRQAAQQWNRQAVDTAVSLLRSGYLVLRTGAGADSYILSQMNLKDKTYSHCGIVMMEHGHPFVYHSIGGEDNPDERLRRDPADVFFSPAHNTGLAIVKLDLDSTQLEALGRTVATYYAARPKFDMDFDLATDDKLYCAEFVYKALRQATGDTSYTGTSSFMGHRYVAVDDLYMNTHAAFVWKTKFK
jgi:Permuted papain-like amidase enzyme, YaeF/YiiX, C92 family